MREALLRTSSSERIGLFGMSARRLSLGAMTGILSLILGSCASSQQGRVTQAARPGETLPGYAATWAGTYQGTSEVWQRGEPADATRYRTRISIQASDEKILKIVGVVHRVRQTGGTANFHLVQVIPDDPRQLSGKMEYDTGPIYSRQEYTLMREGTMIRGEIRVFDLRSGPPAETYRFEVTETASPGIR